MPAFRQSKNGIGSSPDLFFKQSSELSTLVSGRVHLIQPNPLFCNALLSILPAEQKEGLPEHKVEEGKASSGEGSEQQKQTEPIYRKPSMQSPTSR